MSTRQRQPEADRAWSIELHGIEPIEDQERHGRPFELFWIWFAANLGVLGIIYGGILVASGLNLWQSLLVALAAPIVSFLLVGILSVAGKWGGAPMLTLSRASFGTRGNLGPTLVSWISLVGWETISVITAAYALLGLLNLLGLPANLFWTIVSEVIIALLVVGIGLLGHATLVWIQRAATWFFGLLTLLIAVFLIARTHWTQVFALPAGSWDSGVLATLSIIIAGTGIGWANTGADYTRYLPRQSKGRAIVWWTVCGSTLPLFVLIMVGVLLSSAVSGLASAANPIQAIGAALPSWMAAPYLITAIGGLIAGADLSIYSSGLNLLAMGVKLKRYKAVLIDGVLMLAGSVYVMIIAQNFLGPFESFLQLLADGITAWSAVFLVDMLIRRSYDATGLRETGPGSRYFYRSGIRWEAMSGWLAGLLVSLAFTVSPWFSGPFASGLFASISLGYILGFLASGLVSWGLFSLTRVQRTILQQEREKREEA
jgi:nucleobase:cation symporter-1, NCS1 family